LLNGGTNNWQFSIYFYIRFASGSDNTILWGEATKVGDQLFWCEGNATVAVPVAVEGNTDQPFYLVSEPSLSSTRLKAVPLDNFVFTSKVFCLHSPEVKNQCDSGKRRKDLSPLDKLLAAYNIKVSLWNAGA